MSSKKGGKMKTILCIGIACLLLSGCIRLPAEVEQAEKDLQLAKERLAYERGQLCTASALLDKNISRCIEFDKIYYGEES